MFEEFQIYKVVLNNGCGLEEESGSRMFPLHNAAKRGRLKLLQMLLDKGASIDSIGENGQTAVHLAAGSGSLETLKAVS